MQTNTGLRFGAAAGLAALTLAAVPPAHAQGVTTADPADATDSSYDIRMVEAVHTDRGLLVAVRVTDLDLDGPGAPGMSLFLDTDEDRKGPELRLATGLTTGTDYQLVRMENWRPVGDPLSCRHTVRLDAARDSVRFRVRRGCLGRPDSVRVGVLMIDHPGASAVRDWLKGFRRWTTWLSGPDRRTSVHPG